MARVPTTPCGPASPTSRTRIGSCKGSSLTVSHNHLRICRARCGPTDPWSGRPEPGRRPGRDGTRPARWRPGSRRSCQAPPRMAGRPRLASRPGGRPCSMTSRTRPGSPLSRSRAGRPRGPGDGRPARRPAASASGGRPPIHGPGPAGERRWAGERAAGMNRDASDRPPAALESPGRAWGAGRQPVPVTGSSQGTRKSRHRWLLAELR
jgi:hypothetical protein